ncbi:hypothetical protein BJ138DRAFT_1152409 [Hygrophoropsis aurantiaca]|uniref:Uncharacterized protein n=1 Tax=Hygrophoropsis aurantiaca TaxID=72124 RepID=A0ACB8ACX5_9AGAM|nr:hypothetical protein BJ138DRAFT_1152409 [Hygrophoropsis aurantiaca]
MLFKFTKSDMLNSALVSPETGAIRYTIMTRSHFIRAGDSDSDSESDDDAGETHRTIIFNKAGEHVAAIGWKGQQPIEIVVGKEKIAGGAKGIFGCSSAILSRNILGLNTRFDSEYFWMAASDGLTLLDYESNRIKGHFHTNSIRVGDRFLVTPISGLGNDYIEFDSHPFASTEELIVTFILMEILRRSRFNLNPYVFDRPKAVWGGANFASLSRRLRRSTM